MPISDFQDSKDKFTFSTCNSVKNPRSMFFLSELLKKKSLDIYG